MNTHSNDAELHFFSTLHTGLSRAKIAALYGAIGWEVRKLTWTDFEVFSQWGELVIESESPMLMHGVLLCKLEDVDAILAPLRGLRIPFKAEIYDGSQSLIQEWVNSPETVVES